MTTQRVVVQVLMAKDGSWAAGGYGDSSGPGEGSGDWLSDGMPDHLSPDDWHKCIIEADVPLPESVVVRGEVIDG